MSTESNKALVRRHFEDVLNKRDLSTWDELMNKDYVAHPAERKGLEAGKSLLASVQTLLGAAPDTQFTIDEMVAEGDMVAVRWSATGTNTGPIANIPATGKKFTLAAMNFFRIRDGKIADGWGVAGMLGVYQQLGITTIPTPPAAPTSAVSGT